MKLTVTPGAMLSRYKVTRFIGAGGMAEVFEATDTTLGRSVALKILPAELVGDSGRLRRFVQEAKTASALNHPNIVTIYEIGEAAEVRFIAMELVDGTSLAERLRKRADTRSVLGWLSEVADGVGRAHAAGIVHRDLKPDNIMITRDGHAKVLDFGVAKLIEKSGASPEQTTVGLGTAEGIIVGTPSYMSPEQVRGEQIDHRSDIFSMGCILYEAATGKRPFGTGSHIDVMHKIVHDPPESIEKLNAEVPGALGRVIRRCMEKEPQQRFQSMQDLSTTLRDLHEDFDGLGTSSDGSRAALAPLRPRVRRWAWLVGVASFCALLALVAVWRYSGADPVPKAHPENVTFQRVAATHFRAAISPDGKYVAYDAEEEAAGGKYAVWLQQVNTGSRMRVTEAARLIAGLSFSNDGDHIYYIVDAGDEQKSTMYRVPALGGQSRRVIEDADSAPSFSPDGRQMTFMRGIPGRKYAIMIAGADGSAARPLLTGRVHTQFLASIPAWSPDGTRIAFPTSSPESDRRNEIIVLDVASGKPRLLTKQWKGVLSVAWVSDTQLVVAATDQEYEASLWRVDAQNGRAARLTSGLTEYVSVSATADGSTIATVQRSISGRVYRYPSPEPLTPKDLVVFDLYVSSRSVILGGVRGGKMNLWRLSMADHSLSQLTDEGGRRPSVSQDESTILFASVRAGNVPHIWQIDGDGSNPKQLTRGTGEHTAAISPDGKWFSYVSNDGSLWRQQFAGELPVKLAEHLPNLSGWPGSLMPSITADGQRLAFAQDVPAGSAQTGWRWSVISASDGTPVTTLQPPAGAFLPRWIPGAEGLSTWRDLGDGNFNVWSIPLDGKAGEPLTKYNGEVISDFGWSPDGSLFLARGAVDFDVILIGVGDVTSPPP